MENKEFNISEWFMNLFTKKETVHSVIAVGDNDSKSYENELVEKITLDIIKNPDNYSARWFGDAMQSSLVSKNSNILIMLNNCDLVKPIYHRVNPKQKIRLKAAMEPIITRDKKYVIDLVMKIL